MTSTPPLVLRRGDPGEGWALWRSQILSILRMDLRRNLFSRRAIWLYLLAALPVGLNVMMVLLRIAFGKDLDMEIKGDGFTGFYFSFVLMIVTFIGCGIVFMNVFRGEMLTRCLHYYFLVPLRREVLVAGKYLAGLLTTVIIYGSTTLACFVLMPFATRSATATTFLLSYEGLRQGFGFILVTIFACVGYGAIFLLLGLLLKNPVIPGLLLWVWETINVFLPPLLKKLSVLHYLRSAAPMPITDGPFAIVAEPTPIWLALPGLLLLTLAALWLAARRTRHMEIIYGA